MVSVRDLTEEVLMLKVVPLARGWEPFLLLEGEGPLLDIRCLRIASRSDPSGYSRSKGGFFFALQIPVFHVMC